MVLVSFCFRELNMKTQCRSTHFFTLYKMLYTSSLSVTFVSNKTGSIRTTRILDWSMFRFLLYSKPKLEQNAFMIKKCTDSCSLNLYRFQRNLFSSDAYFLQNIVRLISTILMLHSTLISTSEKKFTQCHVHFSKNNFIQKKLMNSHSAIFGP
jgi:hypothetical protein